ncbi:hypothetical protein [Amycolatopsis sp.]|uniref:hypothetical protein n=1 Tax=Amycolatopsis sp. TaxID=37632 RepID=UPI002D7E9AEC|nr:hypothetical protein [Amycolatopsis sp.]HET6710659.1 hypothetical protein [Amycolatopsis sp.]
MQITSRGLFVDKSHSARSAARATLAKFSGAPRRSPPLSCSRKEIFMIRIHAIGKILFGAGVATGGLIALAPAAQAITIPVACSENALVAAVDLANSTPTSDTLVLAGGCTYGMTTAHGGAANALPVITTPIQLTGPATITNASLPGLGMFRIAEVGPTGNLTLVTGVAFTRGNVVGDGGGILNRGAVTLTGSTLTGNTATGNGGGLANPDTPMAPHRPPRSPTARCRATPPSSATAAPSTTASAAPSPSPASPAVRCSSPATAPVAAAESPRSAPPPPPSPKPPSPTTTPCCSWATPAASTARAAP